MRCPAAQGACHRCLCLWCCVDDWQTEMTVTRRAGSGALMSRVMLTNLPIHDRSFCFACTNHSTTPTDGENQCIYYRLTHEKKRSKKELDCFFAEGELNNECKRGPC